MPMNRLIAVTLLFLSLHAVAGPAKQAAVKNPGDLSGGVQTERGWFFFEDPPKPAEPVPEVPKPPMPTTLPPPPKEDKCKKKDTWSAQCGFVNPGEDFEFQAKQRDALFERMTVVNNDPKAVEAVQYYMRWVLERTSEVTNLWWYNMTQNPDLDPTVSNPVTTFGLRLMSDVQKGTDKEIFNLIKEEGGMFVYFSRSDCAFCHQLAEPLKRMEGRTGIPVRNASLDEKCMPNFQEGCLSAPQSLDAARALQVATVPAVFLYVKPNTWLRIATGAVDIESMETRAVQFFSAYRNALLKGVENGQKGRASVDFSASNLDGTSKGVEGATADGEMRLPSDTDISRLLGKSK